MSMHQKNNLPTKATYRKRPIARAVQNALLASGLLAFQHGVMAGPEGGVVTGGKGSIGKPNIDTTRIDQQSQKLSIDWQSFNVAKHERVDFVQPGSQAVALNRILDQNASQIHGRINANGQVFLMNPNGLVFGKTASVNVGGLMATTLMMSTDDFMAGNWQFTEGEEQGVVVNRGLIEASTGGYVNLVGNSVVNQGVIKADLGTVNLASGSAATMDFDGDGLLSFVVTDDTLVNADGSEAGVLNAGQIEANGGDVYLTAKAASDVFRNAVNNEGIVEAQGASLAEDGTVVLGSGSNDAVAQESQGSIRISGEGGNIINTGSLNASGDSAAGSVELSASADTLVSGDSAISATSENGDGGSVKVLGDRVGLFDNANIETSGATGGGEVLVGGNFQGDGPEQNAQQSYVGEGVTISADAIDNGDGGTVIVWSDDTTRYHGTITATGGAEGGDGGFAEVSGKQNLSYRGDVDLSAANGNVGTVLLDPDSIVIQGGSTDGDDDGDTNSATFTHTTTTADPTTVNFDDAFTNETGTDTSVFDIFESEIEGTNADFVLQAGSSISTSGTFTDGVLTLQAGNSLTLETRNNSATDTGAGIDLTSSTEGANFNIITSGAGTITLRTGVGGDTAAPIVTGSLTSDSTVTIDAGDTAGGTNVAGSNVDIQGTISASSIDIDAVANASITGNLTAPDDDPGIDSAVQTIAASGGTGLTVDGDISAVDADVTLTSSGGNVNVGSTSITLATGGTDVGSLTINAADTIFTGATTLTVSDLGPFAPVDINSTGNVNLGDLSIGGSSTQIGQFDVDFNGTLDMSGASISGAGAGSRLLTGNGASDEIIGPNGGTTFSVGGALDNTGAEDGTDDGHVISTLFEFLDVENLTGGTGQDTFAFVDGSSLTGTIDAATGIDTLNLSAVTAATNVSTAASSTDGVAGSLTTTNTTSLGGGFDNINTVTGSGATGSTLTGSTGNDTFSTTATDAGTIQVSGRDTDYSGFDSLAGAGGTDTFNLGHDVTGVASGGAGSDTITLNAGTIDTVDGGADNDTVNFNGGTVSTSLTGGAGSDEIVGPNAATTWTLDGAQSGSVGAQSFASFELITGNAGTDTFNFTGGTSSYTTVDGAGGADVFNVSGATTANLAGGTGNDVFNIDANLTGTIGGDAGADIFDFADNVTVSGLVSGGNDADTDTLDLADSLAATDVTVAADGTNAGVQGTVDAGGVTLSSGFDNIDALTASNAGGTLTGSTGADTFATSATDAGTVTIANSATYSGFTSLDGGAGADVFTIGHNVTGSVLGSTGSDTITLNAGTIDTVDGGADNDTVNFNGGTVSTSLTGGAGSDEIVGPNAATTWTLDGAQSGSVGAQSFASFELITGNAGTDTFNFTGGTSSYTTVDGAGGADAFNVSGATTANLAGGTGSDVFTIDTSLTGSVAGGAGSDTLQGTAIDAVTLTGSTANGYAGSETDVSAGFSEINVLTGNAGTLTGDNVASTWTLDGTPTYNDGGTAGDLSISGFANLSGGTNVDTFNVTTASTFNLAGGTGNDVFNIDANLTGSIDGAGGTNSLTLDDSPNTVTVNGPDTGTATGISGTFSNIANITGGSDDDTFVMADGSSISGTLDGAGHVTADELDLSQQSAVQTVDLNAGTATSVNAFVNVETITNNGGTFTNVNNVTVTGVDSGTADGVNFSGVANITGTTGNDSFVLNDSGQLTGAGFDGNDGTDTLTGGNAGDVFSMTGADAGTVANSTGTTNFANVDDLTGGSGADTFDFADSTSLSGAIDGGGGSDTLDVADVLALTDVTIAGDGSANGLAGSVSSANVTIGGDFDNINALTASAGSGGTLTGSANADTFTTSGTDAGTLTVTQSATYSNFTDLDGAAGADTFNIGHDVTGLIDGGADEDTVNVVAAHNAGPSFDVTAEIVDDNGSNTVTTTAVVLDGVTSVGQSGDRIDINADTLTITNGAGDVFLAEGDSIEVTSVDTGAGAFDLTAGTDVTIGAINSGSTVSVAATGGSINDAADDATADITAGGLVTLTAQDEVGGSPAAGTTTDTAGAIELAAGSEVDVSSTTAGNIVLDGLGALTLTDVDTADGSISVTAAGELTATDVASLNDVDTNDISLVTSSGDIVTGTITAGTAGDVTLNSAGAITDDGDAATVVTADVLTADAAGSITVDTTVASADISTSATGDIDIDETDGIVLADVDTTDGSITVNADGQVTATQVDATDAVAMTADTGDVTLGDVTAGTTLDVTATAGAISDAAGTTLTATGDASFNAGTDITLDNNTTSTFANATADAGGAVTLQDMQFATGTVNAGSNISLADMQFTSSTVDAGGDVNLALNNSGSPADSLTITNAVNVNDSAPNFIDTLDITASGNVNLDEANQFSNNTVSFNVGGTVNLNDVDLLSVQGSAGSDITVTAPTSITVSGALSSGGTITFNTAETNVDNTVSTDGGSVTLASGQTNLSSDMLTNGGAISIEGNLTAASGEGPISTIDSTVSGGDGGALTLAGVIDGDSLSLSGGLVTLESEANLDDTFALGSTQEFTINHSISAGNSLQILADSVTVPVDVTDASLEASNLVILAAENVSVGNEQFEFSGQNRVFVAAGNEIDGAINLQSDNEANLIVGEGANQPRVSRNADTSARVRRFTGDQVPQVNEFNVIQFPEAFELGALIDINTLLNAVDTLGAGQIATQPTSNPVESEESEADADVSALALTEGQTLIPIEPPGIRLPADQEEEDEFARAQDADTDNDELSTIFEFRNIEVRRFEGESTWPAFDPAPDVNEVTSQTVGIAVPTYSGSAGEE